MKTLSDVIKTIGFSGSAITLFALASGVFASEDIADQYPNLRFMKSL